MNKRGAENLGIGMLIMVAITVIVGAVLLDSAADNVGITTSTGEQVNVTVTTLGNGVFVDIPGQDLITAAASIEIYNETVAINSVHPNNFTFREAVSATTGVKTIQIAATTAFDQSGSYNNTAINLTYVAGNDGYIDDAGGRALASLILIFMALAIGVVALVPTLRNGVIAMMTR